MCNHHFGPKDNQDPLGLSPFEAQLAEDPWSLKWQGRPICPTCKGTGRITSTKLLELKAEQEGEKD